MRKSSAKTDEQHGQSDLVRETTNREVLLGLDVNNKGDEGGVESDQAQHPAGVVLLIFSLGVEFSPV